MFAFLAYPLGAFLDWLLGIHGATRFPKRDLKALIELHKVAKKNNVKNEADVPDNANEGKTDRNHENPHSHHIVIYYFLILLIELGFRAKNQA